MTATPLEELRARVDVYGCLVEARERIRERWIRALPLTYEHSRLARKPVSREERRAARGGWTLLTALLSVSDDNAAMLSAWHARFVLAKVIGTTDLAAWNSHPFRTKRDVLQALNQAISLHRGEAPKPKGRGWQVSVGPPVPPLRAPVRLVARSVDLQPTTAKRGK